MFDLASNLAAPIVMDLTSEVAQSPVAADIVGQEKQLEMENTKPEHTPAVLGQTYKGRKTPVRVVKSEINSRFFYRPEPPSDISSPASAVVPPRMPDSEGQVLSDDDNVSVKRKPGFTFDKGLVSPSNKRARTGGFLKRAFSSGSVKLKFAKKEEEKEGVQSPDTRVYHAIVKEHGSAVEWKSEEKTTGSVEVTKQKLSGRGQRLNGLRIRKSLSFH